MNTDFLPLFKSFDLGHLKLKNRIVVPPMVTKYGSEEGFVTDQIKRHYSTMAKGGAGLVVVEATCIDSPVGRGSTHLLCIDDNKFIPGLKELADTIKGNGAKAIIQLYHAGSQASYNTTGIQPVGPSALPSPTPLEKNSHLHELTEAEIAGLVEKFTAAAMRAKSAGFNGIMIHAAHLYLISQFLSPLMNFRSDSYGGSLDNRAKFLREIIQSVKTAVGNTFSVLCRLDAQQLSSDGTINESLQVAGIVQDAGVDAIDISICNKIFATTPKTRPEEDLETFADDVKKHIDDPLLFGGATDYSLIAQLIREKRIDLGTFGRPILVDPEMPRKISSGRLDDIVSCTDCRACLDLILGKHKPLKCAQNRNVGL